MNTINLSAPASTLLSSRFINALKMCFISWFVLPHFATGQPLQPEDIFDMAYASSPRISPDGGWVAHLRHKPDIRTDKHTTALWLTHTETGEHRLISDATQSPGPATWSPDGASLAFVANVSGSRQIQVYRPETGTIGQVSELAESPSNLAWSPDGKRMAFTMFVPEDPVSMIDAPEPPAGASWAADPLEVTEQVYRWDKAGYRKPGYVQLFVLDIEAGDARQISDGTFNHGGAYSQATAPSWTANGRHLIMSLYRDTVAAYVNPRESNIYRYDLETGNVQSLTTTKGVEANAVVSPDGHYIAYRGYPASENSRDQFDVYVMSTAGGTAVNLTKDLDRTINRIKWHPDSQSIVVEYEDQGMLQVDVLDLEGDRTAVLTSYGTVGAGKPYLSSTEFSFSKDGRYAIAAAHATAPSEIFIGQSGSDLKQLTELSGAITKSFDFNPAEPFSIQATDGDHNIQGWMIRPPGFDPNQSYPVIIEVHGGPYAAYSGQFSFFSQLLASTGYVVVYANPRGSTGYGEAFMQAIDFKFPIPDGKDILDVADYVSGLEYIDGENVFMAGGSGGGLLTAWNITQTDRLKAAVLYYPVINWETMATMADMHRTVNYRWFKAPPFEDIKPYRERSPLTYVKQVKTPTLIVTGEEDYRTPMNESEQFYSALRLLGVDTALIRFPNEAHGIGASPSYMMKKPLYILSWFDRYREKESATRKVQ